MSTSTLAEDPKLLRRCSQLLGDKNRLVERSQSVSELMRSVCEDPPSPTIPEHNNNSNCLSEECTILTANYYNNSTTGITPNSSNNY